MAAGNLREMLHFQRRGPTDDGYGNPVSGDFSTVFTTAARLEPMRGSETVIASRLQGVQPYRLTVRSSGETWQVGAEWRAIDARDASRVFNIRSAANVDEKDAYIEMIVEKGVAT
jgi:head-tail adaptor